jgi:glycerophosphoryl diester phosphodiesterase
MCRYRESFIFCALLTCCALLLVFVGDTAGGSFGTAFAAGAAEQSRPIVIAHRGASGYLPEHTLASKALAYGLGSDYIEQDVVVTKDDVLIVLHDIYLDTVTDVASKFTSRKREDGRYYAVDFTLAEILTLQARERIDLKTGAAVFPGRFPISATGFLVPTLDQEIEMILNLNKSTGQNVGIYIEFKAPKWHKSQGKDIISLLMAALEKHDLNNHRAKLFVQCFDPESLKELGRRYKPKFPLVQLIGDNVWKEVDADFKQMLTPAGIKEVSSYASGIGPWIPQVLDSLDEKKSVRKGSFLEAAHSLGLQIHPFTLRTDALPSGYKSADDLLHVLFKNAKVTGVFADQPDVVLRYLKTHRK